MRPGQGVGLGLPEEMAEYTLSGCAPQFALWSFVDLGYLAYYVAYGIATEQIEAADGQAFVAGRMGEYTIDDRSGARCRAQGAHGPVHRVRREQRGGMTVFRPASAGPEPIPMWSSMK